MATGALSPANIASPLRTILKKQKNARALLAEATGIDTRNRRVILSDGALKNACAERKRIRFSTGTKEISRRWAVVQRLPTCIGFRFPDSPAWLIWIFIHLLYIVEFQNRLLSSHGDGFTSPMTARHG